MTEYTRAVEAVSRLRGEAHSSAAIARTNIDEDADTILDALDSLRWRSLESAPKDGEWFEIGTWVDGRCWWLCKAQWSSRWARWWDGIEPCGLASPTHWRPIGPEPGE